MNIQFYSSSTKHEINFWEQSFHNFVKFIKFFYFLFSSYTGLCTVVTFRICIYVYIYMYVYIYIYIYIYILVNLFPISIFAQVYTMVSGNCSLNLILVMEIYTYKIIIFIYSSYCRYMLGTLYTVLLQI